MAAHTDQLAFVAGELSRRMRGRFGTSVYNAGLDYCENFEPLSQGPLLMRAGSEFIAKVAADLGDDPRIINFRLAGQQDALVVLGDQKMRVYRHDGVEGGIGGGGTLGVELAAAIASPPWTKVSGASDFYAGPPAYFTLDENEVVRSSFTVTENGTHRITWDAKSYLGDSLWRQYYVNIGTTPGGQEIRHYAYTISGDWYPNAELFEIDLAPGTYYITFGRGGAVYLAPCSFRNLSIRKVGTSAAITSPWTQAQIHEVQFASETGTDRMILVHPNVEPRVLTCVDGDQDWTLETLTQVMTAAGTSASKPAEWTGTNWPGVIEIHKGRTWWSRTPAERNKLWGSKVGKPFDFGVSTPVVAADAIIETLATKGAICWFRGQKVMLCGTDEGEHGFTAQSGVINPTDIQADEESAFGSALIQAVRAGNKVLYVSQDKRKVRAIGFELQVDGWASRDVTFIAEHITKGGINELHFGKEPHSTIVTRVGGQLRLCTFDEAEKVVAWWRATTRGDSIGSITVTNGPEGSAIWLLVKRAAGILMERIWLAERDDRCWLDASVVRPFTAGVASGLTHLYGEPSVRIVNERGAVVGDFTVDVNGVCTIAPQTDMPVELEEGENLTIGIPFTGKAVRLPKHVSTGKVRSPKIGLLLEDSAIPKINNQRPAERSATTKFDEATGRVSGKVEVSNLGWDAEGKVTIEQDLPLRTEILAIFEITQANEA